MQGVHEYATALGGDASIANVMIAIAAMAADARMKPRRTAPPELRSTTSRCDGWLRERVSMLVQAA